jgi:hypothetical protein
MYTHQTKGSKYFLVYKLCIHLTKVFNYEDWKCFYMLKMPKHEILVAKFFTQFKPLCVDDLESTQKNLKEKMLAYKAHISTRVFAKKNGE